MKPVDRGTRDDRLKHPSNNRRDVYMMAKLVNPSYKNE